MFRRNETSTNAPSRGGKWKQLRQTEHCHKHCLSQNKTATDLNINLISEAQKKQKRNHKMNSRNITQINDLAARVLLLHCAYTVAWRWTYEHFTWLKIQIKHFCGEFELHKKHKIPSSDPLLSKNMFFCSFLDAKFDRCLFLFYREKKISVTAICTHIHTTALKSKLL